MAWRFKTFNYDPELHPVVAQAIETAENGTEYVRQAIEFYTLYKDKVASHLVLDRLDRIEALLKSGVTLQEARETLSQEDKNFDDLLEEFG